MCYGYSILLFLWQCHEGWGCVCRGLGFAGFPPLHSLPFVPCSAQITHTKNPFPPSHPQTRSAQIQGLPRSWTLLCIAKPSRTWFLLPSNHFIVLSWLGLLAQALVSCCSLTPPVDSVAWDVLTGEVSTHTHTHTHPYSFLILRFYVRTMVTVATLVVSLRIFFLKNWCFVLFFHLRKYWPQKAKSLWQEKCS